MQKQKHKIRNIIKLGVFLTLSIFAFLSYTYFTQAQIPDFVNYQGRLRDNTGNPITAPTTIQFSLYSHITNGASTDIPSSAGPLLWTETYDGSGGCAQITPGTDGIFAQHLGDCVSFPAYLDFTQEYYLGVKIGADAEASPRVPLSTHPYAFTSKRLYAENENVFITTGTSGDIVIQPADDVLLYDTNASVGVAGEILSATGTGVDWISPSSFSAGSLWDLDHDTGVQIEEGVDDDTLRIDTAGSQRMAIDNTGNLLLSDTEPASFINPGNLQGLLYRDDKFALRIGETNNNEWDDVNIGRGSFASGRNNIVSGNYSTALGGSNNINDVYSTALGRYNIITSSYAVAGGFQNTASGYASGVFGQTNQATDVRAMAWGLDNIASQDEATAWGRNTRASANYATSWGRDTQASGNYSTAFGYQNTASDDYGLAFGYRNTVGGRYATGWGGQNTVSGQYGTAWGSHNTASGAHSTAFGYYSEASAENGTAIGDSLANSNYMTAIGRFNENVAGQSLTNWVDTDQLFVIGNGSGWQNANRSNALTVLKNGTITAPSFSLAEINAAGATALTTKEYVDGAIMGGQQTFQDVVDRSIAVDGYAHADLGAGEIEDDGGMLAVKAHTGKDFDYGVDSFLTFSLSGGMGDSGHAYIYDERSAGNQRGLEYHADYSANYTNRTLVDKEYVDNQLMWEIMPASTGGMRIQPKNNSVRQIFVQRDDNSYTQFKVRNNNDAGNGAGAIIELKGSGADYTNNMYIGKYGASFWIPELRDNGAVLTDKNLVIGTASDSHEIHFVTGNSYTDLQPVVVADNEGFRYTSDLSATFVDRTLVDKAYVDNAIIAGTNNIYTADGTLTSERGLSGNGGAFGIAFTELNEFNIDDTGSINFEATGDGNFTAPSFNIGSYSTVTLDMTSGVSAIFNDHRVTKTGVEYGADYSANYTNRSLVDKEYVDNAITAGINNIYTADGTLTGNRIITMGTNNLQFDSAGQIGLLFLDSVNNRVGIGTSSPNNLFQVSGLIDFDDATSSTFFGKDAGTNNTANFNTFIGFEAGQVTTSGQQNVYIGYRAGNANTTGKNGVFIGESAGTMNTTGKSNTFVGRKSGENNTTGNENTFIGKESGRYTTTGGNNTGLGTQSLRGNTTGEYNMALGNNSLQYSANANRNVAIGFSALGGFDHVYNNNVVIGTEAGNQSADLDGCVMIGDRVGVTNTVNNRLMIDNSGTNTPLLDGYFDSDILRVNGTFQINDPSGTGYAFPIADGTSGQVLQTDGNGNLSWASSSGGSGVTASNGLTEVGNDIRLGGTLTQNTTVGSDTDNSYLIFRNYQNNIAFFSHKDSANYSYLSIHSGAADFPHIAFRTYNNGNKYEILADSSLGGVITDDINHRGLQYYEDYSANYTNRTLVDKEYVDNQISPFDTTANVTSNENDDYANDDFVFGSSSLANDGNDNHDRRFFFDKSKAAFRAGYTPGSEWDDANVGVGSIALGSGYVDGEGSITNAPIASGIRSTAIGIDAVASGDDSFAIVRSEAIGNTSFAITNGTANGSNSVAMSGGITNSSNSVAMAHGTTNGNYAVAIGSNTTASAYAVAMGYLSTASGQDSVAMGQNSTASALGSVALGLNPIASGNAGIALGQGVLAKSYAEIALGSYNTDYNPNNTTDVDLSDRAFVIGNGINDVNRSDAFIMLKDGSSTFTNVASYDADYSGSYTNHSLVDKAYVDNAVASGGSSSWTKTGTNLSPTTAGDDVLLSAGETLSIADLAQGSIPFIGVGGLFTQDNNNLFWDSGNNTMGIGTNTPSSALDINSNGANGVAIFTIGNTAGDIQMFRTDATPDGSVAGSIGDLAFDGTNGEVYIKNSGNGTNTGWLRMLRQGDLSSLWDADADTGIQVEETADEDMIRFDTAGSQRMIVNNNGYVGINTENFAHNVATFGSVLPTVNIVQSNLTMAGINIDRFSDDDQPARFSLGKARGTESTPTVLQAGDEIMELSGIAYDGGQYISSGGLIVKTDGVPGANNVPTEMTFLTTQSGALGSDEKMVLTSDGKLGIGNLTPSSTLHVESVSGNVADPILTLENGGGDFQVFNVVNSPESDISGSIGDLAVDNTHGNIYIKGTGTGTNTGWLQLATNSGSSPWTKTGTNLSPTAAGDDVLLNVGETLSISDLTQGSIPFIGASGLVSQDNNNLFWNNADNRLGIGTTNPNYSLAVVGTGSGTNGSLELATYANAGPPSALYLHRSGGTEAAPTAVTNSMPMGGLMTGGYDGTSMVAYSAGVQMDATEDWSNSAHGTRLFFSTTANGTTGMSTKMVIDNNGRVGIGSAITPNALLDVRGDAVFNDDAGDYDFRIEGDTDQNLFFVDAGNNRVGIGTATPSVKLQVSGQARASSFRSANGTAGSPSYRFDGDTNTGLFRAAADNLAFTTGGSEAMRIDASGNLGLGITVPTYRMTIAGGALMLDGIAAAPTASQGYAGIYTNNGELYAFDESANSTQISPHDKNGKWWYNSTNLETGSTLQIKMEDLTKDLNKLLGGGYILENGTLVDEGQNVIENLRTNILSEDKVIEDLREALKNIDVEELDNRIDDNENLIGEINNSIKNIIDEIKQLWEKVTKNSDDIEGLKKENDELKKELCKENDDYSWCEDKDINNEDSGDEENNNEEVQNDGQPMEEGIVEDDADNVGGDNNSGVAEDTMGSDDEQVVENQNDNEDGDNGAVNSQLDNKQDSVK